MKTKTTRDDLIQMRDQIDKIITKMELGKNIEIDQKQLNLAMFRVIYATLDFLIRKTWGE